MMPNSAETIENLARALEREKLLSKLNECQTLEDYKKVHNDLRTLCNQN